MLLAALTGLLSQTMMADELIMKNGSRLVGMLVNASDGEIKFDTPFAGVISVKAANVKRMYTERPITLLMADGRVLRNQRIAAQEDALVMMDADGHATLFEQVDVDLINPEPWRLGDGYKWSGNISTAIKVERGNTDVDELDLAFKSIWLSLVDRYTLRGSWEIDETNDNKTKDDWKIRGKYDRFRKANVNYYGWQLAFESDEFADLDLRSTTGPYLGRQIFDSRALDLAGEIGLVYVNEQFIEAEDNDFFASSWELRLSSGWFGDSTEFYVNQVGTLNFDDFDGIIANTTIGIGFPIYEGFKAALEARLEYDGGAVEGVDKLDETYKFRLGYQW
jgi:hypothetical protein